jgi:dihydrofolate reductase
MITLIAAVARNGVIGNGNAIPWHLPEDFKHFSATTKGHVVIMGRKTWDSLPARFRPLPDRYNIVVSRSGEGFDGADFANTLNEAIDTAILIDAYEGADYEIFIIGGASIYEQAMERADRLIISEVDMEPEGDTFFPAIGEEWNVHNRDERVGFTIVDYRRG